jgi:hypothetical protein
MNTKFLEPVEDLQHQDRQNFQDITEDQASLSQIAGGSPDMASHINVGIPLAYLGVGAPKTTPTHGIVKRRENEGAAWGGGHRAQVK